MNLLPKLTVRGMGISVEDCKEIATRDGGKGAAIARVIGILTDVTEGRQGAGDEKPVKFVGKFEGTSLLTGEVYRATALYLPSVVTPLLEAEWDALKEEGKLQEMKIAFDISVAPATNNHKFGYTVKPLVNETVDPFKEIKSGMPPLPPLLNAAKATPKEALEAKPSSKAPKAK